MAEYWIFIVIFIGAFLLISLGAGYAIASRIVGHEAAQRNLRSVIPFFSILFLSGLAIALVLPLLGKYGLLGFNVLWTVVVITYPLSWLWRRRQAGSLVLDLGRLSSSKFLVWLGVLNALPAVIQTFTLLWKISRGVSSNINPEQYFLSLASSLSSVIMYWALLTSMISTGLSRMQLRENGICYQFMRIDWQRITSYAWERAKPNFLTIWFKPRFAFMPGLWSLPIPITKRDEVERILAEYLPGKSRA